MLQSLFQNIHALLKSLKLVKDLICKYLLVYWNHLTVHACVTYQLISLFLFIHVYPLQYNLWFTITRSSCV